jgi:hypothetical protein
LISVTAVVWVNSAILKAFFYRAQLLRYQAQCGSFENSTVVIYSGGHQIMTRYPPSLNGNSADDVYHGESPGIAMPSAWTRYCQLADGQASPAAAWPISSIADWLAPGPKRLIAMHDLKVAGGEHAILVFWLTPHLISSDALTLPFSPYNSRAFVAMVISPASLTRAPYAFQVDCRVEPVSVTDVSTATLEIASSKMLTGSWTSLRVCGASYHAEDPSKLTFLALVDGVALAFDAQMKQVGSEADSIVVILNAHNP